MVGNYQSRLQFVKYLVLEDGKDSCPETSATANLLCVRSQKSEDIIHTAAEACNTVHHV